MKITYYPQVDILKIQLIHTPIAESDEAKPGMILEYDKDGNIIGLEILTASKRLENPYAIEYCVAVTQAQETQDSTVKTQPSLSLEERRAFLKLPLEERHRILAEQAEAIAFRYKQDSDWQELQVGDVIDY